MALAVSVAVGGCAAVPRPAPAAAGNLTFTSSWTASGKAPLRDGEYREPLAPGSTAQLVVKLAAAAFGSAGGREIGAVILVTDPGGSGSFYDLALLVNRNGRWQNTDVVPLGDRVKIRSLRVENEAVVVPMTAHGPGDAMCCPTQPVTRRFGVQDDRLLDQALDRLKSASGATLKEAGEEEHGCFPEEVR